MSNNGFIHKSPKVSIGIPVYNGENYLVEALESLLEQSYGDVEILISDNASTDNTRDICDKYIRIDKRIKYFRNNINIGASANYNCVFNLSSGEYFKWAAHDDVCSPNFLKSCVEKLDGDSSIVLCYPKEIAINDEGKIIENYMNKYKKLKNLESSSTYRRFNDLTCLNHGCYAAFGLIRSSALKRTPKIANYLGSDRVLLAELSLMGRFWESPEPIYFRRHSEQYCALENDKDRTKWFNPNTERQVSFTNGKNFKEYIKSLHRVNIGWLCKFSCYLVLIHWLIKMRHFLLKEISAFIYEKFKKKK